MPWRTVFVGGLGLIALSVAVSNEGAAGRIQAGLTWIADLIVAAADPMRPAIPDLAGSGAVDGGDDGGGIPDWLDELPEPFGPITPLDPLGPLGPGVNIPGVPIL